MRSRPPPPAGALRRAGAERRQADSSGQRAARRSLLSAPCGRRAATESGDQQGERVGGWVGGWPGKQQADGWLQLRSGDNCRQARGAWKLLGAGVEPKEGSASNNSARSLSAAVLPCLGQGWLGRELNHWLRPACKYSPSFPQCCCCCGVMSLSWLGIGCRCRYGGLEQGGRRRRRRRRESLR